MMQLSPKMMTHHSVMTSSLRIKVMSIITVRQTYLGMRDTSLVINQCDLRRPKGASGGNKVFAVRAAQASEARLYTCDQDRITGSRVTLLMSP